MSSQPQRRRRPVVVPYSWPTSCRWVPMSCRQHNYVTTLTLSCSVGNGPAPTRVVYALTTPMIFWMRCGGMPRPVHTPPREVEEEVTKG